MTPLKGSFLLLLTIVFWGFPTFRTAAHVTSLAYSRLNIKGHQVTYRLELNPVDLALAIGVIKTADTPFAATLLQENQAGIFDYLTLRLELYGDKRFCEPGRTELNFAKFPKAMEIILDFNCPQAFQTLLIQYLIFMELDVHHSSIGTLAVQGKTMDFVLDGTHPEVEIDLAALMDTEWAQMSRFFGLGLEHILIGYDHILFLITLIVANLSFRYLITVVTMFTIAHTTTLFLAAFGWITLPSRLVEVSIALTIAYVAVENLTGRGLRFRWVLTFVFGLIHGLGFASVLAKLTAQQEPHLSALFSFNVGVEAGQLLIVLLVYPFLLGLRRLKFEIKVRQIVSLGILAVAIYWSVERAL